MRVLVCDDLPDLREAYARCLRIQGHEVVEASDGQEALELLNQAEFDAVISDHNMPRMTGEKLCRTLRSIGNYVPFMIITGDLNVVNQAKSFGATRALFKGGRCNDDILDFIASIGTKVPQVLG